MPKESIEYSELDSKSQNSLLQDADPQEFLLREVFETSRVAMVVTDGEGNYLRVNDGFCELIGYSRENILGHNYLEFTLPDDRLSDAIAIDAIKSSGRMQVREKRYLRANGTVVQTRVQSLVTRDRDGHPLMALGIMEDITELTFMQAVQKKTETALRIEQQLNRQIIETSPVGITIYSDDGKCVTANAAVARIIGATLEQVKAQNFHQIESWKATGLYRLALETLATGLPTADLVHALTTFGREIWLGVDFIALEWDGKRRLMQITNDLTEFKQAEQARVEAQENYQHLFSGSMDGILITEMEGGRVIGANAAALRMLGVEENAQVGLHRDQIIDLTDQNHARAMALRQTQGAFEGELRFRRLSGEIFDVEVTSSVHAGADGRKILSTIFRDATERKKIEAERQLANEILEQRVAQRTREIAWAQSRTEDINRELSKALEKLRRAQDELVRSEKLAALGALVAGVAHELNTPIGNALLAATTLSASQSGISKEMSSGLRRSTLEAFIRSVQEYSDFIERNLGRASELISSFKQIAVDQTSHRRRLFDLSTVISEVILTLAPTLRSSGAVITNDAQAGLQLDSYPGPLGQVFINLINNAVLHAFDGRAGGAVRFSSTVLSPEFVRISVEDNGNGISPENLHRIFDPFFTTKFGQGGSGLGLHVVHNLVTGVLDGKIEVRSALGQGTVIDIDLPRVAPAVSTQSSGVANATPLTG